MKKVVLPILLVFSFVFGIAQNTVVVKIRYEATQQCSSDSNQTDLTYYLRSDIMRLDFKGPYANSSYIYQPSSKKLWVLYHHEKRFFVMNDTDMAIVNEQVEKAKADYEAKMEVLLKTNGNLPFQGNPLNIEDLDFELTQKKDSLISQLLCDRYDATKVDGSKKVMWLNNLKYTGIKAEELAILSTFSEFMGDGTRVMAQQMDFTAFRYREEKAYPILIEDQMEDKVCYQLQLKGINRAKTDDKYYQVPITYGKMENPLGNRR